MENTPAFLKNSRINWYRCQVDPQVMSKLMQCSDFHGLRQVLGPSRSLDRRRGLLAHLAFLNVTACQLWIWSVPVLLVALFAHGTVGSFLGGVACHEMSHKTPFINDFFLKIFAFLGWWDQVWFRPSHIRHHQVTVHHDYDGEVVLPQKLSLKDWQFWLGLVAWNPVQTWKTLQTYYKRATGRMDNARGDFVLPESNEKLRREHRNWARFTLIGHALLAALFIATGNWFLIFIVNFGALYCGWLVFLCGTPQHYGMSPDVPDHRLCCRTYTCSWLPRFLYWNMNYHIEHHMFPAVPFFNLPKLRKAIENDLPPAPHKGLLATWKEMMVIHRRQQTEPAYTFVPDLPQSTGMRAADEILESEAALTN